MEISLSLVRDLIKEQFPYWSNLHIEHVEVDGHDNRTFHLGEEMLLRLPSGAKYSSKVEIEQKWLPVLAKSLSFKIPTPIAMGKPSKDYPYNWSIYKWIDGESANIAKLDDEDLKSIAQDLIKFLNELHKINTDEAPMPGTHNFYRGSHPFVYDEQTREMIEKLENLIDVNGVKSVWNRAMKSKWSNSHVWIHGDFSPGNIIIKDKKLVGVIDFGGMAVGDPACDLTIAWTFLKNESRKIFKDNVGFDEDLCIRARGWAIWKSLFTIFELKDKSVEEFLKQKKIIEDLIEEDKLYNGK